MFTFKLPTYEELKQNYEKYLKDVQKFYKDWYSDIQKTFNK
jgi:deoxyadenosine/deoxycytidine kinase